MTLCSLLWWCMTFWFVLISKAAHCSWKSLESFFDCLACSAVCNHLCSDIDIEIQLCHSGKFREIYNHHKRPRLLTLRHNVNNEWHDLLNKSMCVHSPIGYIYIYIYIYGLVHVQNENVLIIYSPPFYSPRCSSLAFFSLRNKGFWGKYFRIFHHEVDFNGDQQVLRSKWTFPIWLHNAWS